MLKKVIKLLVTKIRVTGRSGITDTRGQDWELALCLERSEGQDLKDFLKPPPRALPDPQTGQEPPLGSPRVSPDPSAGLPPPLAVIV